MIVGSIFAKRTKRPRTACRLVAFNLGDLPADLTCWAVVNLAAIVALTAL